MIPVKLILENFISHLYSVIDFTKFNVSLILGSFEGDPRIANAVGKSAIMVAIYFVLYGKSNYSIKTKVIKRGKPFCKVEFCFLINNVLYKIVRSLDAKSGIVSVEFSQFINGEWNSDGLTADTSTQTNNKIVEIIGMNHDTFINIVYFKQNDVSGFTSATVSKKKEILKEALQISIWDEYQKISKINEKKLLDKLKIIEEKESFLINIEDDIKQNNLKIEQKEKEQKEIENDINKLKKIFNENRDEILDLEKIISKNGVSEKKVLENTIVDIKARAEQIKLKKDNLFNEVKRNNEIISNSSNDCVKLDEKLIQYYKDILIVLHRSRKEIEVEYKKLTNDSVPIAVYSLEGFEDKLKQKNKLQRSIDLLEFDLKQLTSMEVGTECPACLTIFENPKSVLKRRNSKKSFLTNDIKEKKSFLKCLNEEVKKEKEFLDKAEESVIEVERTNLIISKRTAEKNNAEIRNENIQEELKKLSNEWKELKERKSKTEMFLKNFNNISKITNDISSFINANEEINNNINVLNEKLIKFSVEAGNLRGYGEELDRRVSEKKTILEEKAKIIEEKFIYSELSKAFGKDGIQAIIMENITEDLCQITNSILKTIYYKPMFIDFITQRQTDSGSWKEDFNIVITIDGEMFDFEDLSGGEQVRVSIAIRLALSQLLMRRVGANIKFLLFDEVDQALDRQGIDAFSESINNLAKEFKILVITHNEHMKETFEHTITVHMGPSGSTIK